MAVAKKRNIRRSVGFDKKEMEGYFMIANKDAAIAIVNKLTGSPQTIQTYTDFKQTLSESEREN